MPAVMQKRKRPTRLEAEASAEKSSNPKPKFRTRPSTKKKAKSSLESRKESAIVDKSALQWRSHTEQAEWFTSTFQSVFGSLLSPEEFEPIRGSFLLSRAPQHCWVLVFPLPMGFEVVKINQEV